MASNTGGEDTHEFLTAEERKQIDEDEFLTVDDVVEFREGDS